MFLDSRASKGGQTDLRRNALVSGITNLFGLIHGCKHLDAPRVPRKTGQAEMLSSAFVDKADQVDLDEHC